jgi:hypothetical protein
VTVAADWSGKQLRVAGFREDVRDCLAKVQVGSGVASPATASSQAQATATAVASKPLGTITPSPQTAPKKTPPAASSAPATASAAASAMTKTIMFTKIEEASARKLDLGRIKTKFGLASITVGLATRTITFVGPDAPSLNKASAFVR